MNRTNYSAKREAIYNAICSTKTHPDAEWIYNKVKTDFQNISLGTVYRNLVMLRNDGKIQSLGVVNGCERFDGNIHQHSHFICNKCGRIIDISRNFASYINNLSELVQNELSVNVKGHDLSFYGECDLCGKSHQELC